MPFIHEETPSRTGVRGSGTWTTAPLRRGAVVPVLVLALPTPVQPQPVVAPGGVPAVPVPDLDVDPHEPGAVRDVEPDGAVAPAVQPDAVGVVAAPVEVGPDPCPAVVRAVDPDDQAVPAFVNRTEQ